LADAIRHYNCVGDEIIDLEIKYCGACCAQGDHNADVVETAATCTTDGSRVSTCIFCGEVTTEVIPAIDHSYEGIETAPTCIEPGYTTFTCARCGDTHTDAQTEAKGHSFSEWSVSKEVTRKEAGQEQRICANCAEVEIREIPALGGINPIVIVAIVTAASAVAVAFLVLKKKK
jgi:hypothetical protein